MSESKHTPGPWFVGAQNDALYIIDRRPAHSNDYPDHEADVGCIAKVYDDIRDAEIGQANARLIARAPEMASELDRLQRRVAEMEKDAKRLDYLDAECSDPYRHGRHIMCLKGGLRAAIDAALAASEPQKGGA